MEDVGSIASKAHDVVEAEFKKFDKTFSVEESDIIFDALFDAIEKVSNAYDYRNYN